MRYRYYAFDNKIICISSYCNKDVKAYARCSPEDTFNFEVGRDLARARCDYKIALKRMKRAKTEHAAATKAVKSALEYQERMQGYYANAATEFEKAATALEKLEDDLKK